VSSSYDNARIVEANSLSRWFGEVIAVNNLNLSIPRGVTGLLGPNGAGKSTFIKLMLGLYRPSRGSVTVFGMPPRNHLPTLNRIGYCPETDHFYDAMTGFEFVYWLSRFGGMDRKRAKAAAEAACVLVRMEGRMHDPIDEYSKGMRQRIKIAQALALNPELLILDEPMSGLDPRGREEMFALIRALGEEGRSVIVSSHVLHEVERVTDNIVLLYNGSVLAHGHVREIRELIDSHPHTIEVACRDARAVSRHFMDDPGILSMEYHEGGVILRTRDPNSCYQGLNELALRDGVGIEGIRCSDDSLQAVFDYLVK
jgi:ABC-2 type transport system ATP-binding protein